jgi:predicted DCC family thiol-disulfide oxidoreductase YuxK
MTADAPTMAEPGPARPIVFYDGECGLCDCLVQWVLAHDRRGRFAFAPLQGETFARYRDQAGAPDLSTMVLADETGVHLRSEAALRVLRGLGGGWGVLGQFAAWTPRPLRDAAYNLVARRRKRLFGGVESCRLPGPAERARFLP